MFSAQCSAALIQRIGCERAVIVHPSVYGADMLLDWIPDEAQRNQVLAANPARRYGF